MKIKYFITSLIFFSISISSAQEYYRKWVPTRGQQRVQGKGKYIALIMANNHYKSNGSLEKPIPTARKLKSVLTNQNFDVLVGHDLNRQQMISMLNDFSGKINSYSFAMVFYLGHGFQVDGNNYLIPIDANPQSKYDVEVDALNVDYVLRKVNSKQPKVIVLDACRNNPFNQNWTSAERAGMTRGFKEVNTPPVNTEIFFTIQKGSTVRDDNPYINFFMEELKNGGCLDDIVRKVSKRINNYDAKQAPAKYGQLLDKVCFGDNPLPQPYKPKPIDNPSPQPYKPEPNISPSTFQEWYEKGKEYYNQKQYTNAVYWFKKAAEQGNAKGQFNLGYMYQNGYGVEPDKEKAVSWFKKAAKQGDASGQISLGNMYEQGYTDNGFVRYPLESTYRGGVLLTTDSYNKALYWYRKAAEQGNALGQAYLGNMYYKGYGFPIYSSYSFTEDYDKAVYWSRKAAEQGNALGQAYLGNMYQKGYGVIPDNDTALYWYRKAAEQGNAEGQNSLGVMYYNGYGVTQDFDKAAYWYRKACNNGYRAACN